MKSPGRHRRRRRMQLTPRAGLIPGVCAHEPVIRRRALGDTRCHFSQWWPAMGWYCWHQEECARCGAVLRLTVSDEECPEWAEIAGESVKIIDLTTDLLAGPAAG